MFELSHPRVWVAALSIATAVACGGGSDSIEGRWRATAPSGEQATFEFREDGTATWTIGSAGSSARHDIEYDFDAWASPSKLDLSGFESGQLAGSTLYCIVELPDRNTFRLDCAPGPDGGDAVRPPSFGSQTQSYSRIESEDA